MAFSSFALDDRSSPTRAACICATCANGTTPPAGLPGCPFQRGAPSSLGHRFRQMLATARAPDGPWTAAGEVVGLSAPWDWNTAMAVAEDGSALALIRGGMTWHAANATDNTSWHAVGAPVGKPEGPQWDFGVEDPTVWRNRRNRSIYHSLVHAFAPFFGAHAWAYAPPDRDWAAHGPPLSWHVTGVAYTNVVNFTDGSRHAFARRERPHLIWGQDGQTPIALSNGVQSAGTPNAPSEDGTFTLVQPLRTVQRAAAAAGEKRGDGVDPVGLSG